MVAYASFPHLPAVADTDIGGMTDRLEAIFLSADAATVATGATWYAERHAELRGLAQLVHIPEDILAYIASALSPQTRWSENRNALVAMLAAWQALPQWERGYSTEYPRTSTLYAQNDAKAWRILNAWHLNGDRGEVRALLGKGPKTHSFAPNMLEQEVLHNGTIAITVDSITYQGATGSVPMRSIRGGRYTRIARCISYLARKYGLPAYIFQAIVWVAYRGTGA